jgi:hypothetical protein
VGGLVEELFGDEAGFGFEVGAALGRVAVAGAVGGEHGPVFGQRSRSAPRLAAAEDGAVHEDDPGAGAPFVDVEPHGVSVPSRRHGGVIGGWL